MAVTSGPGTSRTRHIKTDWPFTEGTTAGTTKQEGKTMNLIPEDESLVSERDTIGL